jgi:hypothetical protein
VVITGRKENFEWFKNNNYIFIPSCTRTNLISFNKNVSHTKYYEYVQTEGLCPRRDKKKKNSRKVNGFKKKRREPKTKPDIVFDAILLRRPRSAPCPRTSPRFPKEKEISKRGRNRAADKDTKDKDLNKNYYKKRAF